MKIKDIISIIAGGLATFLLWITLISFIEPANILAAFPCSIVGGYIAGRMRTDGTPSGAVSGLVASVIMVFYVAESFGDWPRSLMFGSIMMILWIIGGGLGELIFNVGKNESNKDTIITNQLEV